MEDIKILSPPPTPSMTFTDQYFILSLCTMKELYNSFSSIPFQKIRSSPTLFAPAILSSSSSSLMKEKEDASYSLSAIFFDKFPLLFHLNASISTSSLALDFLEKLKTHEFTLDDFVKEDYYLPPPEALNTDNLLHLASTTLGYPYENTWKKLNKLVRSGLVITNTGSSNIHTLMPITTCHTSNIPQQQQSAYQYIRSTYGGVYVKETVEDEISDPANCGVGGTIFPASVARLPTPEDEPLYTLIWETTLQSCMKPAYFHRYRLSINTPMPNMSFVHSLDVPIFKGWTRLSSSLTSNTKYSIPPPTPHNVLLYLQSMNRCLPIHCKRVLAESRVSPVIRITETEVVAKLKEFGIGMGEIRKAGFFQTHKKMGFVKDVGGDGGEEFEGFVLSFEKGCEIESFKETRMGEEKTGNRIVLSATGVACATHFHNTYLYLLNSKEYIETERIAGANSAGDDRIFRNGMEENAYKGETTACITKEKSTTGISKELNNYIDEVIGLYMASSLKENTCMERVIGEYKGTELKIKRNEGIAGANSVGDDRIFRNGMKENEGIAGANSEVGYYLEWGKEPHLQRKSLESLEIPAILLFDRLDEKSAIEFIEDGMRSMENVAEHKRIFRVLDPYTSIRHGKYGTYIYHRTEEMRKTKFVSLKKCPFNYMTAPTEEIMEWVYQKIEKPVNKNVRWVFKK
jgi:hypothetical protein